MRTYTNIHACKWIFFLIILLSLSIYTYQVAAVGNEQTANKEDSQDQTISHGKIVTLTDQFMNQLVQEIDDDYKVIHFDTKKALIASFDDIAKREVVVEFIDFYYEETPDGLYIVPTETPPWFIENNDYDVIQLNTNQVEVVQENETDLYGQYIITYEFTFDDNDGWKITKINIA